MPSPRDIRAGRAYVELGVSDKLAAGLNKAAAKFKAFGAGISNVGLALSGIGTAALAPFAAAAVLFGKMGDEINKASQRTGIAVEELSALKYAADQSGSSLEDLEKASRTLGKQVIAAKSGNDAAVASFKTLGLSVQDIADLKPAELFKLVGDRISKIEDPTAKATAALDNFGKAGAQLLPLFSDGAKGVEELEKRAKDLGLTFGGADAEAATKFGDILDDLWKQAKAVAFQIGAGIARALQPFLEGATRIVAQLIEWIQVNRGLAVTIAAVSAGVTVAGGAVVILGVSLSALGIILSGAAAALQNFGIALTAVVSPVVFVVTALGALSAYLIATSDNGAAAIKFLGDKFNELWAVARTAFGGIADALAAGDIQLAANILWTGLKLAWVTGTASLQKIWFDFRTTVIRTAAAAFFGVQEIWTRVSSTLLALFATVAQGFQSLWRTAIDKTTGYFERFFRDNQKAAVDAQLAHGKITKKQADEQKAFIDEQFSKQGKIRQDESAAEEKKSQTELAARLGDIEKQKQATIDRLTAAETALSAAAGANADEDKAALETQITELKAQLSALKGQAQAEAAGLSTAGAPKLNLPGAAAAGAAAGKAESARGTFSAAAIQSLQADPVQERIAKASEQTAKNTRLIKANQPVFG